MSSKHFFLIKKWVHCMDFRAKDGIFHAFVRFFIGISSLTRYVCNSFSQVFIIKYLSKTESNFCLT